MGEIIGVFARDHPAHDPLPLVRGDGGDADRRAARRDGRAAPALAAAAGPAGVRGGDRGDARPRAGIDYSLLIIGRYREQVAAGTPSRRVGEVGGDLGRVRGRGGPDRHARDRGPVGHRHPVHRQARDRRRDRRRRGRRVRADDPADHDRRVRPPAGAEEARARPAVAVLQPLGRDDHRAAVAVDRGRRARPAAVRRSRSPSCDSASPTTATSPRASSSASPTTS